MINYSTGVFSHASRLLNICTSRYVRFRLSWSSRRILPAVKVPPYSLAPSRLDRGSFLSFGLLVPLESANPPQVECVYPTCKRLSRRSRNRPPSLDNTTPNLPNRTRVADGMTSRLRLKTVENKIGELIAGRDSVEVSRRYCTTSMVMRFPLPCP